MARDVVIALDPGSTRGDPKVNLARLEEAARLSGAFGADLQFDKKRWEIKAASAGRRRVNLWFTVHRNGEAAKMAASRRKLQEPFATLLKSIIRLSEAADPNGGPERHLALLRAGRYLHDQLEDLAYDPVRLTTDHFVQAELAAVRREDKEWSHVAIAENLLKLASLAREYRFTLADIDYVPETRPPDQEHEGPRNPRDPDALPSAAALEALPKIAQMVKDPADVCMMRTIELLHCAPWRIGEVLSLPADCEVVMSPEGRLLTTDDLDSGETVRYGLRYKPEKNPDHSSDIKWIPSAAVPLARRALLDIRKHSASSREIAAYMENNPKRAWLPAKFRVRKRLSIDDVAAILERSRNAAYEWLHANGISIRGANVSPDELARRMSKSPSHKAKERALNQRVRTLLGEHPVDEPMEVSNLKKVVGREVHRWLRNKHVTVYEESVCREDVEKRIREMNCLTTDFEWKLSECLFLFPKLFFWRERPFRSTVALMNNDQLRFFMTGEKEKDAKGGRKYGIFKRMGFTEPDGKDIHLTSHMFRRWLATLALSREMSAEQVQNWLGHVTGRPLRAYDHRTPDALAENARKELGQGRGIGAMADIARSKTPRDRDTFLEAVLATAHITPYGMCARDWISSPCPRHGACAACDKHTILKGDPEHREEIVRSLRENRILLARAKAEQEDGQAGAGNYVRHLEREIAALEAALAKHDDASIPEGTLVQLDLPAILAGEEATR
ncbi:hypothetical protein AB7M16_003362 [Bradyrhizobium sp. USDA 372]